MQKLTQKHWFGGALALLAASATVTGARAQMGGDGPPPPPPPPPGAPQGMPPGGGPGNWQGGNATPAQQSAMRAQMLKRMLEGAGIIDVKVQDTVVAFAAEREAATQALQEKSRAISMALRSATATDAEIAAVLDGFRAAVAAERTRRAGAEKSLEAAIGWSKKPRLDALLTTMGLVGDEAAIAGGGGMGRRGMGGRGGMDGPGGGRRGGQNGRGNRPGGAGGQENG
jgi:hypothetical protein